MPQDAVGITTFKKSVLDTFAQQCPKVSFQTPSILTCLSSKLHLIIRNTSSNCMVTNITICVDAHADHLPSALTITVWFTGKPLRFTLRIASSSTKSLHRGIRTSSGFTCCDSIFTTSHRVVGSCSTVSSELSKNIRE